MVACMDFSFIGGSMGNVMGEKIARSVEYAIEKKCPFIGGQGYKKTRNAQSALM